MRISLGDVNLWFDVSGPALLPKGDTTMERPILVAVHGGPSLDHTDSAICPSAVIRVPFRVITVSSHRMLAAGLAGWPALR